MRGRRRDPDEVPICPVCRSSNIKNHVSEGWWCNNCGAKFGDPEYGERSNQSPAGLPGKLLDTDPDEIGGETDG